MAHPLNRPLYDDARGRVTRGLRDPAAARRHQHGELQRGRGSRGCSPASRASTRTRAPSRTSTRTCSAKARSSARASTTSTRSSARSRAAAREPHPEPRPARGRYARSGLVSDVTLFEDYPSQLRRRREPAPSLDPRRLADRRVAGWFVPSGQARPGAESDLAAVALEDPRQPAPQLGADRAAGPVARRLVDARGGRFAAPPRCSRSCFCPA